MAQEKQKKTRRKRKVLASGKDKKAMKCSTYKMAFWAVLALYGQTVTGLVSESFFKQNSPERMV